MDHLKFGRVVWAVRRRRGWRQSDVARAAGVSQGTVSDVERGAISNLCLATIQRVCESLEIRLELVPSWRGGELARLLDARHATLVEEVVRLLSRLGWAVTVEYSYGHFGERGVVDVLAWRADCRALLIVEVKSEVDDVQAMLGAMDRRARLVPGLVARERGWKAAAVGAIVVLPEGSTARSHAGRFGATFVAALPARNVEVRRWLASPGPPGPPSVEGHSPTSSRPFRGILYLRNIAHGTAMERRRGGGGPRRVRSGSRAGGERQSGSHTAAAGAAMGAVVSPGRVGLP
jgi:transcriptional regulator with XRE-family HTH domain